MIELLNWGFEHQVFWFWNLVAAFFIVAAFAGGLRR